MNYMIYNHETLKAFFDKLTGDRSIRPGLPKPKQKINTKLIHK